MMNDQQVFHSASRYVISRSDLARQGYVFGGQGFRKISQTHSNAGVYAVDCEMCTSFKNGSYVKEVIKISIVDRKKRVVYDKLVRPRYQVHSYDTHVHGITGDQVTRHGVSFSDVQNYMEQNFYGNTILVGHSLEHDFRALQLEHSNIVDVSLLRCYKNAGGGKQSLKDLTRTYLGRTSGIHDSVEDAKAAMDLLLRLI